jgi:hypothetical protein
MNNQAGRDEDSKLNQLRVHFEQVRRDGGTYVATAKVIDAIKQLQEADEETSTVVTETTTHTTEHSDGPSEPAFNAVITYGNTALRTLILINGGACIAMLTFLSRNADGQEDYLSLIFALLCFAGGVFAGAASSMLTYFSQKAYSHHAQEVGRRWQVGVVIAGVGSLLLFGGGAGIACYGFYKIVGS